MLEQIMKLYVMAVSGRVYSPLPHLIGPPGCGKSTVAQQLADLLGVNLHVINVSRISPLELEGVQMPVDHEHGMQLNLLTATFWTQLKDGDILLLDEFLRGFPEVYNGLLDILTARQVGSFTLPNVFIMAASNSAVAYDKALEDRLLHLPVPDPRRSKTAKKNLAEMLVTDLGLLPEMVDSYEMQSLLDNEVLPMFDILDQFKSGKPTGAVASIKGSSIRKLIGQAKLRQVESIQLKELLSMNNAKAMQAAKYQFVFLFDRASIGAMGDAYASKAHQLKGNPKLTPIQASNLELNVQLIELENARKEKGITDDEPDDDIFDPPF